MLQNACRELWNYTQESQSIANHSHSHKDAFPITREFLRNTVWLPFYLASDMIIDMITELQASNSLKVKIQRQYTLYIHAFCRDNFFYSFFYTLISPSYFLINVFRQAQYFLIFIIWFLPKIVLTVTGRMFFFFSVDCGAWRRFLHSQLLRRYYWWERWFESPSTVSLGWCECGWLEMDM